MSAMLLMQQPLAHVDSGPQGITHETSHADVHISSNWNPSRLQKVRTHAKRCDCGSPKGGGADDLHGQVAEQAPDLHLLPRTRLGRDGIHQPLRGIVHQLRVASETAAQASERGLVGSENVTPVL